MFFQIKITVLPDAVLKVARILVFSFYVYLSFVLNYEAIKPTPR